MLISYDTREAEIRALNPNFSSHAGYIRCGNRVLGTGAVIVGTHSPITSLSLHPETFLTTFQRTVNASNR